MNFCARLVVAAKGGEMINREAVWEDVAGDISAKRRSLTLKGYTEPVTAYVTNVVTLPSL
jgi:adenylate cyclase